MGGSSLAAPGVLLRGPRPKGGKTPPSRASPYPLLADGTTLVGSARLREARWRHAWGRPRGSPPDALRPRRPDRRVGAESLLDASKRNRLIHFRTGGNGGLALAHPEPSAVWHRLVAGKGLAFAWQLDLIDPPLSRPTRRARTGRRRSRGAADARGATSSGAACRPASARITC